MGSLLNQILAANTGRTIEEIEVDTDRYHYLCAEEASRYGLIDHVMEKKYKQR